jgi:hypothetical protein
MRRSSRRAFVEPVRMMSMCARIALGRPMRLRAGERPTFNRLRRQVAAIHKAGGVVALYVDALL